MRFQDHLKKRQLASTKQHMATKVLAPGIKGWDKTDQPTDCEQIGRQCKKPLVQYFCKYCHGAFQTDDQRMAHECLIHKPQDILEAVHMEEENIVEAFDELNEIKSPLPSPRIITQAKSSTKDKKKRKCPMSIKSQPLQKIQLIEAQPIFANLPRIPKISDSQKLDLITLPFG